MFTGLPLLSRAGTPFGSPNPPVWTFFGAAAIVGRAELPVEKTWVFTNCRGITGAAGGRDTGLLASICTLGATTTSSGEIFVRISGGGTRNTSTGGVSTRATCGGGISRTGAGSWFTSGGVSTTARFNTAALDSTNRATPGRPMVRTNSFHGGRRSGSKENGAYWYVSD